MLNFARGRRESRSNRSMSLGGEISFSVQSISSIMLIQFGIRFSDWLIV